MWRSSGSIDYKEILPHSVRYKSPDGSIYQAQDSGPQMLLPINPVISAVCSYSQLRQIVDFQIKVYGKQCLASDALKARMALLKYFLDLGG